MSHLPIASILTLVLTAGCALVVPDPRLSQTSPVSDIPSISELPLALVSSTALPVPSSTPLPATPPHPVLLRRISSLQDADGAWIVTRGTILDDVAAFAGGKPILHDPVLDDRGGSLRLVPSPGVIAAARNDAHLVTGTLTRVNGRPRLLVARIDPLPSSEMTNLTIDDRAYEPGERLALSPGLHRITIEARGLARVEFALDDGEGPFAQIGVDNDGSDGFSMTWSALPDQTAIIRTTGFTLFDEPVNGPALSIIIGPTPDS